MVLTPKTMTIKQELEQLKKQFAELEAKIANEQKQEIKTVEDAFNKLKPRWFLDSCGGINGSKFLTNFAFNQCNMTSEKEAKRMKALIQLRRNAEAMNEGVDGGYVYFINLNFDVDCCPPNLTLTRVCPIFKNKELAEQALINFKPLFEDLYAE
jgi:hypothetical protein